MRKQPDTDSGGGGGEVKLTAKERRWLTEASWASGMYAGVLAEHAPVMLRNLEKRGLVYLNQPHNPVHKPRYAITPAGLAALAQLERP